MQIELLRELFPQWHWYMKRGVSQNIYKGKLLGLELSLFARSYGGCTIYLDVEKDDSMFQVEVASLESAVLFKGIAWLLIQQARIEKPSKAKRLIQQVRVKQEPIL